MKKEIKENNKQKILHNKRSTDMLKLPKKMTKDADNFILAWGNTLIITNYLKIMVVILFVLLIFESFVIIKLASQVVEEKPLPIFIDRIAGDAKPVDYTAIDARGEKRHDAEVAKFCKNFIGDLYTYNKYTVVSNLKSVKKVCTDGVYRIINDLLIEHKRYDKVNEGIQGIVDVKSVVILKSLPDLKVQVFFVVKEKATINKPDVSHIAIFRIKTIIRNRKNAHGLYVIEYRDTVEAKISNEGN
jgi:hypothetical protein